MADVTLNFALDDNFWNRAVLDGRVTANGVRLNAFVADHPTARHEAMHNGEYDAAEVGYSGFIRDQVLGVGYPQLSLPVWGNRGLRHRNLVTRPGSRIAAVSDLEGGRVGCVHYGMTTNIWARQVMSDAGVRLSDVTWVVSALDDSTPTDLKVEVLGEEQSGQALWPLLARDELDAVIAPGLNFFYATFRSFSEGSPAARLSPEYQGKFESVITDAETCLEFVRRTRVYPIIHSMTVKREILEQHPWLAAGLVDMFRESAELAPSYMSDEDRLLMDRERQGVGFDPHAQGWNPSQEATTHALMRAMVEQHLIPYTTDPDTFMVPGYRDL